MSVTVEELISIRNAYSSWLLANKTALTTADGTNGSLRNFASDIEDELYRLVDDIEEKLRETGEIRDYITYYQIKEGGEFLLWPSVIDSIPSDEVLDEAVRKVVSNLAIINYIAFFGFKTKKGRLWDIKAGWHETLRGVNEINLIIVDDPQAVVETAKAADSPKPCTCGRWQSGDCDDACISS